MTLPESNLADTVDHARQLEPVALKQIYDRYFAQLFRYAQFRLGEDDPADAACTQVFNLWLDTQTKRLISADSLDYWFFESARKTIDLAVGQTGKSQQSEIAEHPIPTENLSIPQKDEAAWLSQLVSRSLRKLLPDQQHILALRFAGPCSIEETARLAGKSIVEIKGIQFDALVALRKLLEAEA